MNKVRIEVETQQEIQSLVESLKPFNVYLATEGNSYYLVGKGNDINRWAEGNVEK